VWWVESGTVVFLGGMTLSLYNVSFRLITLLEAKNTLQFETVDK